MPIYEYACSSCGHELEVIQKMSDDPLTECPKCHNNTLKKQISAGAFQLKGSGWYETDFKGTKSNTPPPAASSCGTGACPACTTD
jgi:putative FmdB family regulatory protein